MDKRPGGNIDSWCGKCKLILAHTIEAMVGDKPARVSCNTCRSQHSYKAHPPQKSSKQTHKTEGTSMPAIKSAKSMASRYQSLVKAKETTVIKAYSPQSNYEQGDVLEHPTFGRGAVTSVKDGTKIEVLFETGMK